MGDIKDQTLEAIKARFPDEYLLVEVTNDDRGVPTRGILRSHGKDRKRVLGKMHMHSGQPIYFFYNGVPAAPDTAYVL